LTYHFELLIEIYIVYHLERDHGNLMTFIKHIFLCILNIKVAH